MKPLHFTSLNLESNLFNKAFYYLDIVGYIYGVGTLITKWKLFNKENYIHHNNKRRFHKNFQLAIIPLRFFNIKRLKNTTRDLSSEKCYFNLPNTFIWKFDACLSLLIKKVRTFLLLPKLFSRRFFAQNFSSKLCFEVLQNLK